MSKVHVKTGDTVVLLTGKDIYQYKDVTDKSKGRLEGKVVAVSPKEGKVIVEGFNKITKHVKPTRMGQSGGIVAPHDWGVTTQKGNRLFVHILNLKDKSLFLPLGNQKVKKAFDFASKKPVKVQKCEGGVLLNLGEIPTEMDKVVEIAL